MTIMDYPRSVIIHLSLPYIDPDNQVCVRARVPVMRLYL